MGDQKVDRINCRRALLHTQKQSAQSPSDLELQNYLASLLRALDMGDVATEVWAGAITQANAVIPEGHSGQST